MIDIGVNLTHPSLFNELDANMEEWKNAGVSDIIAIASNLEESKELHALAKKQNGFFHTLGCHPHHADSWSKEDAKQLSDYYLSSNKAIAIGETGLDFNRNHSTQENQISAFIDQIDLAKQLHAPLYLHERDAQDQLISILKNQFEGDISGVLHCFTADKETLRNYLDLGLHIGITGWICDERRGQDLQNAVKYIPKDKILIETDSPYLLPRSIRPRPKKNHPKFLPHIVSQICQYLALNEEELTQLTRSNTKTLFNLTI